MSKSTLELVQTIQEYKRCSKSEATKIALQFIKERKL